MRVTVTPDQYPVWGTSWGSSQQPSACFSCQVQKLASSTARAHGISTKSGVLWGSAHRSKLSALVTGLSARHGNGSGFHLVLHAHGASRTLPSFGSKHMDGVCPWLLAQGPVAPVPVGCMEHGAVSNNGSHRICSPGEFGPCPYLSQIEHTCFFFHCQS